MSDNPIVVSAKPIQLSGTVKGPIVVTPQEGDSGDTTISKFGYNQPTYKVKLIANGKTFNMLLPPSIESKHPGRSNPLQLPGLQIKAGVNISKLKIPGFFPIYQNLGVETLTVSMSGMFTGYDGTNVVAAANWENAVGIGQSNVEQGQDSFTSASELYDFAVNNKALVQVTIYTSDGSFIPKKSASTTFRDTSSNISFKGYIKEFEQVYIRQDRNYYMLKFEIIDFGNNTNKCKTVVKSDKAKDKNTTKQSNNSLNTPLTPEDIVYLSAEELKEAKDIIDLINCGISKEDLVKRLSNSNLNFEEKSAIAFYAKSKGYRIDSYFNKLQLENNIINNIAFLNSNIKIDTDDKKYRWKKYIDQSELVCRETNKECYINSLRALYIQKTDNNYISNLNRIETNNSLPLRNSNKNSSFTIKGSIITQLNTARKFLDDSGSPPEFYNTVIRKDLRPRIIDIKAYSSNITEIQNRLNIADSSTVIYVGNKTLGNAEFGYFLIENTLYYATLENRSSENKIRFIEG